MHSFFSFSLLFLNVRALLLNRKKVCPANDDDDDDDAAASEIGELFSTTKAQNLSLSLEHKTPNRARARRIFFFRDENEDLSLTSLSSSKERAESTRLFYSRTRGVRRSDESVVFLSSVLWKK